MESDSLLKVILQAWQEKNPELLRDILADQFEWYDSPFENVITNPESLIRRWHADIANQEGISIETKSITASTGLQIVNWRAEFDRNSAHEMLDGIFFVYNNSENKLTKFQMWWVNRQ